MEHKEFYQQSLVTQSNEFSEEAIQSLYAQIFLEFTLFHGEKERLEKAIDQSLEERDHDQFLQLTDRYMDLLTEYESGIIVKEQGVQFHVYFGNYKTI
ncbi:IDEAL domain-containing protein [Caldalkalibacillus mannanilyticus]|uniref:IDEAL domain-containing protein n=1 Tax=Caldalkalibacillus mannanilyticus TaxID=1418 RepID=UPI000468547F|nr:IDEAL domain-containing protein [Caldalkalibacillus mannanilyticus]